MSTQNKVEQAISVRIPVWAQGATLAGQPVEPGTYAKINRIWQPDDQLVLELPLAPRLTVADAARGVAADRNMPMR